MNFERDIDPKEAMGLGYAGLIRRFHELARPYGFEKECIPKTPYFYHHKSEKNKWIQHWSNSWNDLISLYETPEGTIRVFSSPANGPDQWDQCYLDWMKPTTLWNQFDY